MYIVEGRGFENTESKEFEEIRRFRRYSHAKRFLQKNCMGCTLYPDGRVMYLDTRIRKI